MRLAKRLRTKSTACERQTQVSLPLHNMQACYKSCSSLDAVSLRLLW